MRNRRLRFLAIQSLAYIVVLFSKSNAPWVHADETSNLLKQYCYDCHGDGAKEGNLSLDQLIQNIDSGSTHEEDRQLWWKVLSNMRAGTMPPPESEGKLSKTELAALSEWIKTTGLGIDKLNPDPGRTTLRRLNRREYANTIRDLLGIDFNVDIAFPPDDTGFGFDNVADALSLSPLLVEKYLLAASQIVQEAVPTVHHEIPVQRFRAFEIRGENNRNADNMRLNQAHRVGCSFEVVHPGEYTLEVVLKSDGSFEFSPQRCQLSARLNEQPLFDGEYGWDESKRDRRSFQKNWQPGSYRIEFELSPIELTENVRADSFAELDVESVSIRGPADPQYWQHPKNYERIFTRDRSPEDPKELQSYAHEIFERFGERAFRRPLDNQTIERLVAIAEHYRQQSNVTFEASVAHAIVPILASPRFLFRQEDFEPSSSTESFPLVDEYALASRLSYFLWSSMPDEKLFALARAGELRSQLQPTITRMLADPKSKSLVQNFVGQWLRTRDVEKTSIDPIAVYGLQPEYDELLSFVRRNRFGRRAPEPGTPVDPEVEKRRNRFQELKKIQDSWDQDVRISMRRETEMLFEFIVKENRDLAEIIDPGYTFLNERLAGHYGIEGVRGPEMRRVELPAGSIRGGILTQGTLLAVTSNPTRGSPVKRGLYILENILGTPTPPAPPNVPALEDATTKFQGREPTLKELLAAHREDALCSSCHSRMDPLGIALENFNAIGMWRDNDKEQPIDASGKLVTGESFADFRELRKIIATHRREDFYRCITQKMLTYALGRGIDYYDEHTLDSLVTRLLENEGRFEELVIGIIESTPFQRGRKAPPEGS